MAAPNLTVLAWHASLTFPKRLYTAPGHAHVNLSKFNVTTYVLVPLCSHTSAIYSTNFNHDLIAALQIWFLGGGQANHE